MTGRMRIIVSILMQVSYPREAQHPQRVQRRQGDVVEEAEAHAPVPLGVVPVFVGVMWCLDV